MTAGDLVVVLAALLLSIGFAALVVVLLRVLDTLRDLRRDVVQLREETRPLLDEMRTTTDEAKSTVDEARHDLERFDKVLGSAEAIGDAVGSRVTKTAFSSPAIKAAGLAKGTGRVWARLRGRPVARGGFERDTHGGATVIDVSDRAGEIGVASPRRRRRRA